MLWTSCSQSESGRTNYGGEAYLKEITIEVWGRFRLFLCPLCKSRTADLPIPNPICRQRDFLSAIYMKPKEFRWQINRIEVLNPIRYISFKRNEVKCTVGSEPISTEEERTQRQTTALQDVRYRIAASIIPRPAFCGKRAPTVRAGAAAHPNGKMFPSAGAWNARVCLLF